MGGGASKPKTTSPEDEAKAAEMAQQNEEQRALIGKLQQEIETLKTVENVAASVARPSLVKQPVQDDSKKQNVRRGEVSAEAWNKIETADEVEYEKKMFPKEDNARGIITSIVDTNILFKGLRADEKEHCVDAFYKVSIETNEEAITQGDDGDKFFVVEKGSLDILMSMSGGMGIANYGQIQPGASFGELSLMYNTPRAATIKAKEACIL